MLHGTLTSSDGPTQLIESQRRDKQPNSRWRLPVLAGALVLICIAWLLSHFLAGRKPSPEYSNFRGDQSMAEVRFGDLQVYHLVFIPSRARN
jgi:hypothetical protein